MSLQGGAPGQQSSMGMPPWMGHSQQGQVAAQPQSSVPFQMNAPQGGIGGNIGTMPYPGAPQNGIGGQTGYMGMPQTGNAQMQPSPAYQGVLGLPNQPQIHNYYAPHPVRGAQPGTAPPPGWTIRSMHPAMQAAMLPGMSTTPITPTNS